MRIRTSLCPTPNAYEPTSESRRPARLHDGRRDAGDAGDDACSAPLHSPRSEATSRSPARPRTARRRTPPPRPGSSTTCSSSRATTTTGRSAPTFRRSRRACRRRSTTRCRPLASGAPCRARRTRASRSSCCRPTARPRATRRSPRRRCSTTRSGTFRIRSTGESRGVRRSIVSTFRRSSFLDYLYFTDYETSDPLTYTSATDRTNAASQCVKYRAARASWCRNITFFGTRQDQGPAAHERRPADVRLARLRRRPERRDRDLRPGQRRLDAGHRLEL